MNQPSVKPQEGPVRLFPQRSVPNYQIENALKAKDREETRVLRNPIPVSAESLRTGRQLFIIYCAACHGLTGTADSPVSAKIAAISLVDDYVQTQLSEGWIFGTVTFGSGLMPAYGNPKARDDQRGSNDLSVEQRCHVVNYVKYALAKLSPEHAVVKQEP